MFNSKKTLFVLTALLLFCLVFGTAFAQKSYYYNYTNNNMHFSIQLPNNWERKTNVDPQIPIMAISPLENDNDQFRESISVAIDKNIGSMDLNTYLDESIKSMKQGLIKYKTIQTGSIKIGTENSKWLIYSHQTEDGFELKAVAYFLTKGGRGYVITCTSTPADWMNFMTLFEEIAHTFKFI